MGGVSDRGGKLLLQNDKKARITVMTANCAARPAMWSEIWAAMWRRPQIWPFEAS